MLSPLVSRGGTAHDVEWGAVFVVLLLTSSADAQPAQPAQPAGQSVNVLGCVSKGVEVGCLIIKDRATGKTYQINAAKPAPDPAQILLSD